MTRFSRGTRLKASKAVAKQKCCAPITSHHMIQFRSSRSAEERCQREGAHLLGGKWFCYQHVPAWRTHYEIVERIRSIPNRDAVY